MFNVFYISLRVFSFMGYRKQTTRKNYARPKKIHVVTMVWRGVQSHDDTKSFSNKKGAEKYEGKLRKENKNENPDDIEISNDKVEVEP